MAEPKSEGGGAPALNLNSLLALLTLAGGVWLVSHKLASDRPVTPAGGPQEFLGEQTLEARLWEDPFKSASRRNPQHDVGREATNLNVLVDQIQERSKSNPVLLLPVMLSSGQYTEDKESRIRSRYAVVSALGQSGYAPEDAEHIGTLRIRWPTQHEVDRAENCANPVTSFRVEDALGSNAWLPGTNTFASAPMNLRYEWYRRRIFFPNPGNRPVSDNVLVLWLDDSFFEDEPLLRLPLLLESLTDTNRLQTPHAPEVALIGPRRSSTLRAMLPDWTSGTNRLLNASNTNLWPLAGKILRRIKLYCATPSAMDEVLVTNATAIPRRAVQSVVTNYGFVSFQNFAVTDAQLAREIIDELALRNVNLTNTQNHLVLISEWDTFYARMLSLTYGTEIAVTQNPAFDRAKFVQEYRLGKALPTNLHSFVYLRGLDGQTVEGDSETKGSREESDRSAGAHPTSLEELRRWVPDANKAEGQAQFDYLSRLGDQLAELENHLYREDRGHIRAIGIVGSDVYDTLLILQALRDQFPDVLFFTTDLDARFCQPRERKWARNLIVASGYGLTLHPYLQGEVATFRDSTQTAQFAATLAALGNSNLANLSCISPRRFEIGNRGAVDLSVTNTLVGSTNQWLHPLTPGMHEGDAATRARLHLHNVEKLTWSVLLVILTLFGVCWLWDPLRHLTVRAIPYLSGGLDYSEEDVGGPEGVEEFVKEMDGNSDPMCRWISAWLSTSSILNTLKANRFAEDPPLNTPENKEQEQRRDQCLLKATDALVQLLNSMLRQRIPDAQPLKMALAQTALVPDDIAKKARLWVHDPPRWRPIRPVLEARRARRFLDLLLGKLAGQIKDGGSATASAKAALRAGAAAREAAAETFRLRCRRLLCFWIGVLAFCQVAVLLGFSIWNDTFKRPDGEPFSLTSGTSAWPAEILRLLVFASAVCLSFELCHRLRETYFALTRKFRLSFESAATPDPSNRVCALALWRDYRKKGVWWRRLVRIALLFLLYVVIGVAIMKLSDQSILNPVRGKVAELWDRWLLAGAVLGFLVLAFLTMDAARLCHRFIRELSQRPTEYPEATRRHFSRQRGNVSIEYLDDWIGLQLIADLTERVSALVYFPTWLLLLLLLARNSWWDCWSWPLPLIIMFTLNVALAAASVVILQRAAIKAKHEAEERLTAKVKKLQARAAPSPEQNDADRVQELLEEIQKLRRGAFVPFWENPVVGAVVLSSGGTTMLQLLIWFMGR